MSLISLSIEAAHHTVGIPADYARSRGLPFQSEAAEEELTVADFAADDGSPIRLTRPAADAWHRMRSAAAADGVTVLALSGFRSVARQTEIFREQLAKGRSLENLLASIAAPGFSEHHTGRAIDLGSPDNLELIEAFERTEAFRWLTERAGGLGFALSYPRSNAFGIVYEPWHWCWTPNARRCY